MASDMRWNLRPSPISIQTFFSHRLKYVESFFDDFGHDGLVGDLRNAIEKIDRPRYRRARYLIKELAELTRA
jgi:hypothetical protein